jgi:hypothetical protein
MTLPDYIILTQYDGITPKCKCGLCDEHPHLYRGKFLQYAKGHDSFKFRENKYREKFGSPTCLKCGIEIGFYRGEPNIYCSTKCSPGEWNQETIKNTINERYGVNNIMEIKEFRDRLSTSLIETWSMNRDEILDKIKISNNKKFGVDFAFQSNEIKERQRMTMNRNHGVDHYSKTDKFRKDSSSRMVLNNPMKIPENVEKMINTTMINDNHGWKNFHLKYKETELTYQSTYEYDFLEFCEKNSVLCLVERSPSFQYLNKKSYHFPDYIFSDRYIIEIKSNWVLNLQGGMSIIQEKINSIGAKYKYILILDKDYREFENIMKS